MTTTTTRRKLHQFSDAECVEAFRLNREQGEGLTLISGNGERCTTATANAMVNRGEKIVAAKAKADAKLAEAAAKLAASDRRHCQCCGRAILANTGVIAHHGYERPGYGWQTGSCMGARTLPWSVSRDRLGDMIDALKGHIARLEARLVEQNAEAVPMVFHYRTREGKGWQAKHTDRSVHLYRDDWEMFKEAYDRELLGTGAYDFDRLKERNIRSTEHKLSQRRDHLKECQTRYDGWKQTEQWNAETKRFEAI